MSAVPSPVSTLEALGMLVSAMGFFNAADAGQMAAGEQARCLGGITTSARQAACGVYRTAS